MGKKKAAAEPPPPVGPPCRFIWCRFGEVHTPAHSRWAFNANAHCNILTDAIKATARKQMEDYARTRDAELRLALEDINQQAEALRRQRPPALSADGEDEKGEEATEADAAAARLDALEEERVLREKQIEELLAGASKFQGLLEAQIDLVSTDPKGEVVPANLNANPATTAVDFLTARETYTVAMVQEDGSLSELTFEITPTPETPEEPTKAGA